MHICNRMSLPAMAPTALGAMASISPLDSFLHIFNTNPYFIGIMMLVLNLGGRFIGLEVTKKQEQFLQHPWIRRLLIFTVIFVATRSLWVAFWTTLTTVLLLGYLFNENSALCVFGKGGSDGSSCSDKGAAPKDEMTPEEKEILHRLHSKAQRYHTPAGNSNVSSPQEDDVLHTEIYAANLSLLRR